jgi:hypothetical protein
MYLKSYSGVFAGFFLVSSLALFANQASLAKTQKPISSTIQINASPEAVFDAIQKLRDCAEMHRKLMSYDGKVATIKENLEGVPIYGKVECMWQEKETSCERIDYTMLSSTKFKSGFGSWILTPSADKRSTKLELQSFLDSGLRIPFAGEITKMGAVKDAKVRLQHIKDAAEAMAGGKAESAHTPASKSKKYQ